MTRTGRISQQPTENSNHDNGNDDDLLYDIKCCNPSDDEPDDILLTSDEESDQESNDVVLKKKLWLDNEIFKKQKNLHLKFSMSPCETRSFSMKNKKIRSYVDLYEVYNRSFIYAEILIFIFF